MAEAELPNRNVVPVHQPATEDGIAQTVRDNWALLNRDKTWRKGINAAIRWYQEHPQELFAQLENLKLEQEVVAQAAAKPAKGTVALETVTTPGTAEARTRWANTLDLLKQELPRATFETWLRPTEGHSVQGNDLTVLVASPHDAEWLEQRVYQTILRKLRQGSDQKLDVRFALGPPGWSPPGAGGRAGRRGCAKPKSRRITWRLTRRANPRRSGRAPSGGCAAEEIVPLPPGQPANSGRRHLVGAADRDHLGPGRRYGASPRRFVRCGNPQVPHQAGPKSQTDHQAAAPDPGAVFAFEGPLRAPAGSGNAVPTKRG